MEAYFQRLVAALRFQKRSEEFFETPYRSKENSRGRRAGRARFARPSHLDVWPQDGWRAPRVRHGDLSGQSLPVILRG
jgi:hypothetical protein